VPVLVRFMRVFLLFRSSATIQSVFLFYGIPYLFYRISIFIELEGPQGLPETDISPCRVVVHIAAQEALMMKRLFTSTVAHKTVKEPGDLPRSLICALHSCVLKKVRIERCPRFASSQRFVFCNRTFFLGSC
jgi:hypothetical protein